MILTVMIRNSGAIASGLTPKLYGWNTLTREPVVNDATMLECGKSGIYTYNFTRSDEDESYAFLVDAGAGISDGNERYIFLSSESLLHQD